MPAPNAPSILALRKQHLLVRSAELRQVLIHQSKALAPPLANMDRVVAGVQWLLARPALPLAGLVFILVVRPRKFLGMLTKLWWGWGVYRKAVAWLGAHRWS